MRHDQILVIGVELHQLVGSEATANELLPTVVDEHPFDEVLAKHRVAEPPLLFHRQQRQAFHQHPGIDTHPDTLRHALFVVNLDTLHATTGRGVFQDIAGNIPQLAHRAACECRKIIGGIEFRRSGPHGADLFTLPDQTNGLARNSQTHARLRAKGDKIEIGG